MRNQKKSLSLRLRTLLILSLVFATVANLTFTPYTTQAVSVGDMSPTEQAKSWLYFNAMASCVDQAGTTGSLWSNTMSPSGVNTTKWFNSGRENPSIGFTIGAMGVHVDGFPQDDSSGRVECGGGNIEWIGDALRLWGYSDNLEAWCDLTGNLKRKDGSVCSGSSSSEGWDTIAATSALRDNFERAVRQKIYNGATPSRTDAARYAHAQAAFYGGCLRDRTPPVYTGGQSGDTVFKNVSVVNLSTGAIEKVSFAGVKKQSDSIAYSVSPAQNSISDTCAGLVGQMAAYANAYSKVVKDRVKAGELGDTGGATVCEGGGECVEESTSCVVEGVGWFICPITNFMAGISDGAFSAISSFLTINPDLYNNTDSSSGTYAAWAAFRNIANIAFAILFIFIIYSQLTGMGVSNYGIKKTLPRLVIAALLVNLSFFVCQLAVDITQIIGGSINGFLQNIPINGANSSVSTWEEVMNPILTGALVLGGVATGAAVLALSISIPLLLAFLAAVVMTIIILVGREAAIVILIILSPLAFVAYLLPNTEKWFKRWYQMFGSLLMVYPIIALLYGGGALASKIIANAGNTSGGDDINGLALGLTAIAISAIPLLMTPTLLKNAMSSTGSIGAKLAGLSSKANGRIKSTANNSRLGEAKQGLQNKFALRRASSRANGKGINRVGKAIDDSWIGKKIGLDKGAARAVGTVLKEDDQEVEAAAAKLKLTEAVSNPVTRLNSLRDTMQDAIDKGDNTKARAAQRILLGSGSAGISKVQEVYANSAVQDKLMTDKDGKRVDSDIAKELRTDINGAGLKGKNNALATYGYKGAADSFGSHLSSGDTYSGLNPVELAGQSADNIATAEGLKDSKGNPAISASMASAVLNNASASALLDGKKRATFERIASISGGTAAGAPQQSPTGQQAGAGPGAPSAGASSAAQRARDTAAQAAQGTQGPVPFTVSSSGEVNPVLTVPHNPPAAPSQPPTTPTPPTPPNPGSTPPPPAQ